jgi:hypothetical protein
VSCEDVRNNVSRYYSKDDRCLLTLGTALLLDHLGKPMPFEGLMQSLEANLNRFLHSLDVAKKSKLRLKLLNGRNQFLNTISELALANYFLDAGYTVKLDELLAPSAKDADLHLVHGGETRWIDVINAAPHEWQGEGFGPFRPHDFAFRLRDKVLDKYKDKFAPAVAAGWCGDAWIALDFTKNDSLALAMLSSSLVGDKPLAEFAQDIFTQQPGIRGVVYYTHYVDTRSPHWVQEFRNSEPGTAAAQQAVAADGAAPRS